jgi:putative tryptophan/tyrosine transport system substrate-binding protein
MLAQDSSRKLSNQPSRGMSGRTVSIAIAMLGCFLCGMILASPTFSAEIVILKSADITAYNQAADGFKAMVAGTATITEYDMQGDLAKGRKLARRVRASNADLVLAVGTKAALAAKLEIVDIPILFCMVLDPEKSGLNAPNMTGILLEVPIEHQFATMHSVLPGKKKIGVLFDPEKTGDLVEEARRHARAMGLELVTRQIRSEKEVPAVLRSLIPTIDALWLVPDSTVLTEESISFLLANALDANIPVLGFSSELVRNGALAGLSVHYEDVGRQASGLARKILSGQIKAPSRFGPERVRLALNLKTAKFLGITIPAEVVNRADQLY